MGLANSTSSDDSTSPKFTSTFTDQPFRSRQSQLMKNLVLSNETENDVIQPNKDQNIS